MQQTWPCIRKLLLLIFICSISQLAKANNDLFQRFENSSVKPDLDVIVGLSKPPYVIQQKNAGFELELVQTLLDNMGYKARFIYVPIGRGFKMLDQGMGDVVMTINKNIVPNDSVRTKPYITYQNVAISKASKKLSIKSFSDLSQYRLAAFQLAHKYLGQEYKNAVENNKRYIELPNQFQQVKMLLEDRVDVLVMDINIFYHMLATIVQDGPQIKFKIDKIFPLNPYSLAFKDERLVAKFNEEIDAYLKTEEYASLKKKYNIKN